MSAVAHDGAPVHWPSHKALEQLLMTSVKNPDSSAAYLKRMLNVNPAYGAYLTSSNELAELVQLFAKRFRSILTTTDQPLQVTNFYEPLCELVWRAIGNAFNSILELEEGQHLPVPQIALGQVKMLIQTNEELSRQLKESRRAYLRELVLLREKNRKLSPQALAAVQSLREEPIMFYEPLTYILDETTKDFVREVVEERIKLEMRRPVEEKVEPEGPDYQLQLQNALEEVRLLKASIAAQDQRCRRLEEAEFRAKEEIGQLKRQLAQKDKDLEGLQSEIDALKRSAEDRKDVIKEVEVTTVVKDTAAEAELNELRVQYEALSSRLLGLQDYIKQLELEKDEQARLLRETAAQVDALKKELDKSKQQKKPPPPPPEEKVIVKTELIKDDSAESALKAQMEKHLKIEKELNETIRSLQAALNELKKELEEAKKKLLEEELRTKKVAAPVKRETEVVVNEVKTGLTEADVQAAVDEANAKWKAKMEKLQAQLVAMEKELAAAEARAKEFQKELSKRVSSVVPDNEVHAAESRKWKKKYEDLLDAHEQLQRDYEILQNKLALLIEKLQKLGGDEAVRDALAELKLELPPNLHMRQKKAWERLYDDALRRLLVAQSRMNENEFSFLDSMRGRISNRSALFQVDALRHLRTAQVASADRFHQALASFQGRYPDISEGLADPRICEHCGHRLSSQSREGSRSPSPGGVPQRSSVATPETSPSCYSAGPLGVQGYSMRVKWWQNSLESASPTFSGPTQNSVSSTVSRPIFMDSRCSHDDDSRFSLRDASTPTSPEYLPWTRSQGLGLPLQPHSQLTLQPSARGQPQPQPPGWAAVKPGFLRLPPNTALQPIDGTTYSSGELRSSPRRDRTMFSASDTPTSETRGRGADDKTSKRGRDKGVLPDVSNWKELPAKLIGGAGAPQPALTVTRSTPILPLAPVATRSTSAVNINIPQPPQEQSKGLRFFVAPLVSQQSLAMGIPLPIGA